MVILVKETALKVFRQPPECLNCAQTVLHAYQVYTGDKHLHVEDFKAFGGGRAPENCCGALHAACQAAPSAAAAIRAEFEAALGSTRCKALKSELHIPCEKSVETAAQLLQKHLPR